MDKIVGLNLISRETAMVLKAGIVLSHFNSSNHAVKQQCSFIGFDWHYFEKTPSMLN